jgi:hypothetical protein
MTSQRDVVFTPFMLRVRAALDGEDRRVDLRLQPSALRAVANTTDEWVSLRARSEQVLAEANAMVQGSAAPLDLEDEAGTGELAFVLRCRERFARISMRQAGRQSWLQFQRSYAPVAKPVEPEDPQVLEDLVIELLADSRRPDDV